MFSSGLLVSIFCQQLVCIRSAAQSNRTTSLYEQYKGEYAYTRGRDSGTDAFSTSGYAKGMSPRGTGHHASCLSRSRYTLTSAAAHLTSCSSSKHIVACYTASYLCARKALTLEIRDDGNSFAVARQGALLPLATPRTLSISSMPSDCMGTHLLGRIRMG